MEEILNFKKRFKKQHFLLGFVILVFLVIVADILFLFFGGPFLAQQLVLPLPPNSIKYETSRCFSSVYITCKFTDYLTAISPQDIAAQWPSETEQRQFYDGRVYYEFTNCNESWLGLHYSSIYKNQLRGCATMMTYYDNELKMTRIRITTKWPVCLNVVDKYADGFFNQYFKCYEG